MLKRSHVEYNIKIVPASVATGVEYFQVHTNKSGTWQLATPWKFLSWKRAWLWIDKKLMKGD